MEPKRGGRPKDPAVGAAIRSSLGQLLFDRGLELTYEDVAAHAGVGRTSVFRRYPTKQQLLQAAFAEVSLERITVPDTGSARTDLRALLIALIRVIAEPRLRRLLRQALGQACRDPAFTGLLRAVLDARMALIDTVVDRGIQRGELAESTDRPLLADLVSGLIAVRLASDAPLPDEPEVDRLVVALLDGFADPVHRRR